MTNTDALHAIHVLRLNITPRQLKIIRLHFSGIGIDVIAKRLKYSRKTIEQELTSVRKITGAANYRELYLLTVMAGLVELPEWATIPCTPKTQHPQSPAL